MKIVVSDDENDRLDEWLERLKAVPASRGAEFVRAGSDQLKVTIRELEGRRLAQRNGKSVEYSGSVFDGADVLVLDFDLADLDANAFQTGEGLAYLARCFSSCGYILELNQFGENRFDLTLRGHPASFADLNIGSDQIDNPGLWSCDFPEFRPWAWPIIVSAQTALERRVATVARALDESVLAFLGFDEGRGPQLSRDVLEFLSGQDEPKDVTFRTFVSRSGHGLRGKDATARLSDQAVARIAAARIGRWLEKLVVPSQDMLIDAPHLVTRLPSLLRGDSTRVASWNATARTICGEMAALKTDSIERHLFQKSEWLSRPAWWWNAVANDASMTEVNDPFSAKSAPYVFCEDTSMFASPEETRSFVAQVTSPFVRRFVRGPTPGSARERVTYEPAVAFAI